MTDPSHTPTATFDSPTGPRIVAGIAGAALAVGSAFVSFGVSFVAIAVVCIGWLIARKRGQPFTRGVSWLVGVGAVAALILIVFGAYATKLPSTVYRDVGRTLDSAQAAPPPAVPEWLRRVTPPNAQQQTAVTNALIKSRAFTIWTGVMGVSLVVGLVAAYAGTLGWGASLLLLYAATGRWLPRATRPGPPGKEHIRPA